MKTLWDHLAEIWRELRRNRPVAGPGIRIQAGTNGTQIIATTVRGGGGSGTTTAPVKITAKTNYNTYTADVYANGLDQDASEEDITLRVAAVKTTITFPNNTILWAVKQSWPKIGGGDGERTDYWTAYATVQDWLEQLPSFSASKQQVLGHNASGVWDLIDVEQCP